MAVYVINDGGSERQARSKDLSPAARFGTLTLVSKKFLYPSDLDDDGHMNQELMTPIGLAARKFNPAIDYLLPIGDLIQVLQFVALVVSAQPEGPEIRVLRWDREQEDYYVVNLRQFVSPVRV